MTNAKTSHIDETVLPNTEEIKLLIKFNRYDHEKGLRNSGTAETARPFPARLTGCIPSEEEED